MYWFWTCYVTVFLQCWRYLLPKLIRYSLTLGQFPDLHIVSQVEIQMFAHSLNRFLSLWHHQKHMTHHVDHVEENQIFFPFHSDGKKSPMILNCIIASYKINYFICLNTVTLLFSSDLLLPSVCITVIFSTPTLCTLKCQNPPSIIPVISLSFLTG